MNVNLNAFIRLTVWLVPLLAYAATGPIFSILSTLGDIFDFIIFLLMALATLVFLWGIILYVIAGDSEDKVDTAKRYILIGLVGLFVMIAAWAIVRAVLTTFNLRSGSIPPGPGDINPGFDPFAP